MSKRRSASADEGAGPPRQGGTSPDPFDQAAKQHARAPARRGSGDSVELDRVLPGYRDHHPARHGGDGEVIGIQARDPRTPPADADRAPAHVELSQEELRAVRGVPPLHDELPGRVAEQAGVLRQGLEAQVSGGPNHREARGDPRPGAGERLLGTECENIEPAGGGPGRLLDL